MLATRARLTQIYQDMLLQHFTESTDVGCGKPGRFFSVSLIGVRRATCLGRRPPWAWRPLLARPS